MSGGDIQKDHKIKKIAAQLFAQLPDDHGEAVLIVNFLWATMHRPRPVKSEEGPAQPALKIVS